MSSVVSVEEIPCLFLGTSPVCVQAVIRYGGVPEVHASHSAGITSCCFRSAIVFSVVSRFCDGRMRLLRNLGFVFVD